MARLWKKQGLPPLHIRLYAEQIFETDSPRFTRGCFQHEASKFRVKDRGRGLCFPGKVSKVGPKQCCRYSLYRTTLNIGNSSAFCNQLLIRGQCSQNVCLPQRKSDLAVLVIVAHYEIFNLAISLSQSTHAWKKQSSGSHLPRLPTKAHPSLFLLRFSKWQGVADCHVSESDPFGRRRSTYFNPPRPNLVGHLLGLWPLQRSSQCALLGLAGMSGNGGTACLTANPCLSRFGPAPATRAIHVDG